MTVTNSELNSNDAKLNAEDISLRVLKLLDSLKSNSNLTPEHILQTTGWRLSAQVNDPKYSVFGESISHDWGYGLELFPNPSNAKKNKLFFSFDRITGNPENSPMTPVCALDFNHYASALKAAGFEESISYGEHGRIDNWDFYRGDIALHIYIEGEANEPVEKITHHCVKMIIVE